MDDRKRAETLLRRLGKQPQPSYVEEILAAFAEERRLERERCEERLCCEASFTDRGIPQREHSCQLPHPHTGPHLDTASGATWTDAEHYDAPAPSRPEPLRKALKFLRSGQSLLAIGVLEHALAAAPSAQPPLAEPTTIDDYRDAYGRMATQAADLQERIEDLETELRAANGALSEANTSLVWVTSEEGARSRRIVDNAMARINSLLGDAPARAAAPEPLREAPHAVIPGFDAREWVALWRKTIAEHPGIPTDDDTMLTWFANAIMRGYDEARALAAAPSAQPPLAEPSPPASQASETPAEGEVWKALDTAYLRCITCGYNLSNSEWWKFTRLKTCWCAPLRALLARRLHGR